MSDKSRWLPLPRVAGLTKGASMEIRSSTEKAGITAGDATAERVHPGMAAFSGVLTCLVFAFACYSFWRSCACHNSLSWPLVSMTSLSAVLETRIEYTTEASEWQQQEQHGWQSSSRWQDLQQSQVGSAICQTGVIVHAPAPPPLLRLVRHVLSQPSMHQRRFVARSLFPLPPLRRCN